jgi:DNA-binding NtrC family response regulator
MEHKEQKTHAGEEKQAKQLFEYPIIGKSKAVDQLIKQISSLAKSRRDVAIIGEAGVGKGAVAKNIYITGKLPGKDGPFLSVNLSVADDRELDALLIGHDHAVEGMPGTSHRGLFDDANGGTVLLEELEQASFRNQMKILTFINERKTRRQSGDTPGVPDIRLIVTMKSDPGTLAEQHKLMEELFVRVNEFERVEIPPLRQRQEDIPLLIKHFTSDIRRELGLPDLIIDINAIDVLVRQPWRENIRELKSIIDKCVLFSTDGRFMLPPELVDEKTEVVKMISNIVAGQEFVLDKSLDVIEKGIIERSLDKFGFNQSKAAQFLGMTEQTFRYKLKRLGIASARTRA